MKNINAKRILTFAAAAVMIASFAACSGSSAPSDLADGTYTGRSAERQEDEDGNGSGYGEVELEIKDNKVVSCTFKTYELDGTLKDESYGAEFSKENRMKAQKAVQAADKYAEMYVSEGSLDSVDAISGATINYDEFKEAVNDALEKAAE